MPLAGSSIDEIGLHILCGQPHDLARARPGFVQNIDQQAEFIAIPICCTPERSPVRIIQDHVAGARFLAADGFKGGFPRPPRYAFVGFGCQIQCGFECTVYPINRRGLEALCRQMVAEFAQIV